MPEAETPPWQSSAFPRLLTVSRQPYSCEETHTPEEYDASTTDSLFLGIASPHQRQMQPVSFSNQAIESSYPIEHEHFIIDADISHLLGDPHILHDSHPSHPASAAETPGHDHAKALALNRLQDFSLDQNLFVNNDFQFDDPHQVASEGHTFLDHDQLSAYPPSHEQAPITPAMSAANRRASNLNFSQRPPAPHDRSHSYHSQTHLPASVCPELVFTPLISPMVNPSDIGIGSAALATFEPLSSPALKALSNGENQYKPPSDYDRRRSSLSAFGHSSLQGTSEDSVSCGQPLNNNKRRTPHGTPILHANQSSSILSHGRTNSPATKAQPIAKNGPPVFERLPEASVNTRIPSPAAQAVPSNDASFELNSAFMGFTMRRLADLKNDTEDLRNSEFSDYNRDNTSPMHKSAFSRSIEDPNKGGPKKNDTHKMAEQGRRNRMNVAVSELGGLIPQKYHDEITVPSKATTIELGSRYIRELVDELEKLKSEKNNGGPTDT